MKILLFLFFSVILLDATEALSSREIEKVNAATLNTLLIFTSQEGLNSGLYHFTNTAVDVDMKVYHLPFTYHIKTDSDINYFIVGNVGYSQIYLVGEIQQLPPDASLDYDSHIQTFTAGLGGGMRYRVDKYFCISGGVEFIYSRSGLSLSLPKSDIGNRIEEFFNNNYSSNLSYKLFALAEYRPVVKDFKPYATFGYKLFETKSTVTFDELLKFDSQSSVATLNIGIESPKLFEYGKENITLEAYLNTNYLNGTVKDVVNFSWYQNYGLVGYYNTPIDPAWASRFFLELSTARSDGLEGYNIGIGFTVDF
jgi:hypothetical protein